MKDWISSKLSIRMRFTLLAMLGLFAATILSGIIVKLMGILHISFELPEIIWLLILSTLIGGVINSFFSKSFFDPILRLSKAMKQVAAGDLTVHLEDVDELKEIQEIYSNFNLMTKELRATEILQTDFVSNVSHEFKTPISAIEGYATLLQGNQMITKEEQETYVEKILLNTHRLSELVGNILLLSKIDNQAIQSKPVTFRLDEQIRQSIVMLEPKWEKKEIEFDVDLENIEYTGNESLMYHVWDNLIGNAIKFNPQGGSIYIKMRKEKKKIVFYIDDNGPGISEEDKHHIFDKFYQSDSSHKEEGNGLGLALVKQILQVCNGEIMVENLSGGCRFTVVLYI